MRSITAVCALALVCAMVAAPSAALVRSAAGQSTVEPAAGQPTIESAAAARLVDVSRQLSAEAKKKLLLAALSVAIGVAKSETAVDVEALARQEVQRQFPSASAQQRDVLACQVIGSLTGGAKGLGDDLSNHADLGGVRASMAADKQARLVNALGAILKTASASNASIVQNLK